MITDGIENLKSGLGTSKDQKTHTDFSSFELTKEEMETAYRFNWVISKAVDIPAKDMTKKWITVNGSSKHKTLLEKEHKKLAIKSILKEALIFSALYGEAIIIIESESKTLKSKLSMEDKISSLTLYSKFEIEENEDIHETRLYSIKHNHFGDSILFKIKDTVLNFLTSLDIPASLLHRSEFDFLSIKGLASALEKCKKNKSCQDAEEKILKRVQSMYEQLSLFKIGIKDSEETFETFSKDVSSYDKLQLSYMYAVSGAVDIPMTRFFGRSPGGMSSTGEGDSRNYYDNLEALQAEKMEPFIELINTIILNSNGIRNSNISFEFNPLWTPTAKDLADTELIKAQTIAVFIDELDAESIAKAAANLKVFDGIELVLNEQEEN